MTQKFLTLGAATLNNDNSKAIQLRVLIADSWRNIAITLIDPLAAVLFVLFSDREV
jgi:hypothetical protein